MTNTEHHTLTRSARWLSLWALGVGAVISGDFFGWQFGLLSGGFLGMLIATVIMGVMYVCIIFSIAELSAALPSSGGFYAFTSAAFGRFPGFLCGVNTTIEYVITPAVIGLGISTYMQSIIPELPIYFWWVATYAVFVYFNIRGSVLTFRFTLLITLLAVAVLLFFYITTWMSGAFHWNLLFNMAPSPGHSKWLPHGSIGIIAAIPSAIWFFLAIEELPMAAEETVDVSRHMPKALMLGMLTLFILALLTLTLNSGVGGGASFMANSLTPLRHGLEAVLKDKATTTLFTLLALTGLVASFHCVLYGGGRIIFALSRDRYFPRWMSHTNHHKSPAPAVLTAAIIGLGCMGIINLFGAEFLGQALINMAIFGAVISYVFVMISFIKLRISQPHLIRPYVSPLGIFGATLGGILACVALLSTFILPELRPGIWGLLIILALATVYYFFRKKLGTSAALVSE